MNNLRGPAGWPHGCPTMANIWMPLSTLGLIGQPLHLWPFRRLLPCPPFFLKLAANPLFEVFQQDDVRLAAAERLER